MRKRWVLRTYKIRNLCVRALSELDCEKADSMGRRMDTLEVVLRPYKKNRSLEQNDMFHAWCGEIARVTGHSKGEVKEILVESVFGTHEYLNFKGEVRSRVKATSDMNTTEMAELIERTVQIGTEMGATAPEIAYGN